MIIQFLIGVTQWLPDNAQKIALEKGTKKPPQRPAREFPRQPTVQPPKSDSQSLAGRGDFTIPKRGKH
jgi:hypothetical protein